MWEGLHVIEDSPPPGPTPLAAVLVPLYEDAAGDIRVVLTKRPDTMPTHAGHIAFPGGRPDPTDSGPIDTALREAYEEVGIPASDVSVLGFLPAIHTVEFSLLVVPVVGRLRGVPALVPSEREVAMVLEPRLADLAEPDGWRFELWQGRPVWFYDLDGEILWGATARMMRQLLRMED
jgi:8-oxo-dGTP pyrophosphatase MutT (NUDIX family)